MVNQMQCDGMYVVKAHCRTVQIHLWSLVCFDSLLPSKQEGCTCFVTRFRAEFWTKIFHRSKLAQSQTCCIRNVHFSSASMVTDLWPKLKLMNSTKRWQNTSERPTFAKVHLSNNGVIKSTRQYWISITRGFIVYTWKIKNKKFYTSL